MYNDDTKHCDKKQMSKYIISNEVINIYRECIFADCGNILCLCYLQSMHVLFFSIDFITSMILVC